MENEQLGIRQQLEIAQKRKHWQKRARTAVEKDVHVEWGNLEAKCNTGKVTSIGRLFGCKQWKSGSVFTEQALCCNEQHFPSRNEPKCSAKTFSVIDRVQMRGSLTYLCLSGKSCRHDELVKSTAHKHISLIFSTHSCSFQSYQFVLVFFNWLLTVFSM